MLLRSGWQMQSALKVTDRGDVLSSEKYRPTDWYKVSVPTTIIAGLLAGKAYDFDPFFDRNYDKLYMPSLDHPWWFRKVFTLPATKKDVILKLHGINYKANIWLNGVLIADSNQVMGYVRFFEFNITRLINPKGPNVLAIEVRRPFNPQRHNGDLAIDYADWIHPIPDANGGILNDVEIDTYDKVGLQFPLVTTHFDGPSLSIAHLTVQALVTNYSTDAQDVVVRGVINDKFHFEKQLHLAPNEISDLTLSQLDVQNPPVWWPWQYGKPNMSRLRLSVVRGGVVTTDISESFGIREITSKLIDSPSRVFIVNGKRILLRGAAWSPDAFQRRSAEKQEQMMRLYRDMNMNILRSEGKMEDENFYRLCDKYGMLLMTGWMCCGAWQYPENWDAAKRATAMASDSSVMYWLRDHPSLLVWLNGSDMPPRDTGVERSYLNIEQAEKWPNPVIATADGRRSAVSGYSGVKMLGPYEWVPPIYWETDTTRKFGGATFSLATEISPGPSIPPYESLIKFLPKDSIWYTTASWNYHCGIDHFATTDVFTKALEARYGSFAGIDDYLAKAQAQNYEAHRAMMEAYGLNKYHTATGVVQWMGNNPWPGLIWHTFDYYMYPAGTYFGMKKAMEPLHIMYSYASNEVDITNGYLKDFTELKASAAIYDIDGHVQYNHTITTTVGADSVQHCFTLPPAKGFYFLRLQLADKNGKIISINWYWLSQKPDVLDWQHSSWNDTPQSGFADYTALKGLGKTTLSFTVHAIPADSARYAITISNKGKVVAFQVHLRALKGKGGDDILPVLFSDNYLELAPGESRTIQCSYAGKAKPYFKVSSW